MDLIELGSILASNHFLYSLKFNSNWKNKKAIILGSGGSAKAVLIGLKTMGFSKVIIINRNAESIERFLKDFNISKTSNYQDSYIDYIFPNQYQLGNLVHLDEDNYEIYKIILLADYEVQETKIVKI